MSVAAPMGAVMSLATLLAVNSPLIAQAPPIQDNSFLVEEAYNQERGVVQHVGTFTRSRDGAWLATFTQEWPLGGMRSQGSYDLALMHHRVEGTGPGDVTLNYRYQLTGSASGAPRVFTAPRVSIVLPTGNWRAGRGAGSIGLQAAMPLSVQLSPHWAVHGNAGLSLTPSAHDPVGNRAAAWGMSAGSSVVWLAMPTLNFLVEGVWERSQSVTGDQATIWSATTLLNPGVRLAINLPSGMQIVPGVAWTLDLTPESKRDGIFLYLSVEHGFR